MSISSAMSDLSVSYYGEELSLEDALNDVFAKIQPFVNDTHVNVRSLAMGPEQDDDYMVAMDIYHGIIEGVDGMTELMKELKKISKEVLGKPPTELKQEVAAMVLAFKQKQLRTKMDLKREIEQNQNAQKENIPPTINEEETKNVN